MIVERYKLILGDCLQEMKTLADNSIDLCLTDPPYGTTACKWDSVIPFAPMWKELKRICKPKAAICLFGSQPFTSALIMSNPKDFRYEWIWNKGQGSNFALANKLPMKAHENILVFSSEAANYFPQKTKREKPKDYSNCDYAKFGQTTNGLNHFSSNSAGVCQTIRTERFPLSILNFPSQEKECNNLNRVHPNQKPVELLRYLIKTYTQENETVLDFTMGSGSCGVACQFENRQFIGIEKDEKYFEIAKERIEAVFQKESLFAKV